MMTFSSCVRSWVQAVVHDCGEVKQETVDNLLDDPAVRLRYAGVGLSFRFAIEPPEEFAGLGVVQHPSEPGPPSGKTPPLLTDEPAGIVDIEIDHDGQEHRGMTLAGITAR